MSNIERPRRSQVLQFRVTPGEADVIRRASLGSPSLSEWARDILTREAREELARDPAEDQ